MFNNPTYLNGNMFYNQYFLSLDSFYSEDLLLCTVFTVKVYCLVQFFTVNVYSISTLSSTCYQHMYKRGWIELVVSNGCHIIFCRCHFEQRRIYVHSVLFSLIYSLLANRQLPWCQMVPTIY